MKPQNMTLGLLIGAAALLSPTDTQVAIPESLEEVMGQV